VVTAATGLVLVESVEDEAEAQSLQLGSQDDVVAAETGLVEVLLLTQSLHVGYPADEVVATETGLVEVLLLTQSLHVGSQADEVVATETGLVEVLLLTQSLHVGSHEPLELVLVALTGAEEVVEADTLQSDQVLAPPPFL